MITIETIQTMNHLLAWGGLIVIAATIALIIDLRTKRVLSGHIQKWGLIVALKMTLVASALTLVYSEVFGVIPCGFCWIERVMLYPQVLILLAAAYFKDRLVSRYGIVLSGVGLLVSLYHHYIQMGGSQFIKCPAAGAGADCAKRFIFEFNFITFPLLSAIIFAFLIVLYLYILKTRAE